MYESDYIYISSWEKTYLAIHFIYTSIAYSIYTGRQICNTYYIIFNVSDKNILCIDFPKIDKDWVDRKSRRDMNYYKDF